MEKEVTYIKIRGCVSEEMQEFEQLFESVLCTRVPMADAVIRYYLGRTGKQLRPILTLLAAKMVGKVTPATIKGAVSLELLHNATLMHDDVIDQSMERRGCDTINKIWDNRVAVLMGDFFLSKCLACCNSTGSLEIPNILAELVALLVEGELEQISNIRSRVLDEETYFSVIRSKTASLFAACMKVGALSVGASQENVERMSRVGELMGLIFQIRDDIFDYYPETVQVGKPTGHDILEGKITLPLLYAFEHAPADESERMHNLLEKSDLSTEAIEQLVEFAKRMGGIEYAQEKMEKLALTAKRELDIFPESEVKIAMVSLIDYFVRRNG